MTLGQIRVDAGDFPLEEMACMRCGQTFAMRFAGACPDCVEALRAAFAREAKAVDATYEPKMNVTPNAVALKDD